MRLWSLISEMESVASGQLWSLLWVYLFWQKNVFVSSKSSYGLNSLPSLVVTNCEVWDVAWKSIWSNSSKRYRPKLPGTLTAASLVSITGRTCLIFSKHSIAFNLSSSSFVFVASSSRTLEHSIRDAAHKFPLASPLSNKSKSLWTSI